MKKKLIKLAGVLCPMCMAFGFFITNPVSFLFFGEPKYPETLKK
ncbi:MAG: cyclic lactone autoinducer peptide [Clostridium sp.]|nr:cyclic lactone autoinducer peptide [Clostridium sp.]